MRIVLDRSCAVGFHGKVRAEETVEHDPEGIDRRDGGIQRGPRSTVGKELGVEDA